MGKIGQTPKNGKLWGRSSSSATVRRTKSWPDFENSLALGLQRGVNNLSAVHPLTCSLAALSEVPTWGGWALTESMTLFYQPLHLASHVKFVFWWLILFITDANKRALWCDCDYLLHNCSFLPVGYKRVCDTLSSNFSARLQQLASKSSNRLLETGKSRTGLCLV